MFGTLLRETIYTSPSEVVRMRRSKNEMRCRMFEAKDEAYVFFFWFRNITGIIPEEA